MNSVLHLSIDCFLSLIFVVLPGSVIITSLQNIVRNEGFRGMYRGLSPTIVALLPNWAVSFFSCCLSNYIDQCLLQLKMQGSVKQGLDVLLFCVVSASIHLPSIFSCHTYKLYINIDEIIDKPKI